MSILHADDLILRPLEAIDTHELLAATPDRDVSRWIAFLPHPNGIAEAEAFVDLQMNPKQDAQAVTHDSKLVGCITIATELGCWFATAAARAVVSKYFDVYDKDLESGRILGSDRSQRALSKLRFAPTVAVSRASLTLDQDVTVQRMMLPKSDWQATL